MSKNNGHDIPIIGEKKPRMEIGPDAAKQIEDHYSGIHSASRAAVRESIRKWNAGEEPKTLAEAGMFDIFREIARKVGL